MIVRTRELKELEAAFQKPVNTLVLCVGTAFAGQGELLREFLRDKNYFYYRASEISNAAQAKRLSAAVQKAFPGEDGEQAGDIFRNVNADGPLVFCIDGFEYIERHNEALVRAIRDLKARKMEGHIMILLVSRSMSRTEKDLSNEKMLRFDTVLRLGDVPFLDVVRAFPDYTVADAIAVYGIIGGVPAYIARWDGKRSIRDNVIEKILSPAGALHHAAAACLGSELRELSVYNTILSSIASGHEKLNDLYQDTGFSRAKISVYLKNLAAFGAAQKAVSFDTGGWDNTKKGVYRISDHFLSFWFTFIEPFRSELTLSDPADFYDAHIAPGLDRYLAGAFTEVCREYLSLMSLVGKTPVRIRKIGTWIGKHGTIDIVGQNEVRENIVGQCSWRRESFPVSAYDELLLNMQEARIKAKAIYLFSATDFDPALTEIAAEDPHVIPVDMKEL